MPKPINADIPVGNDGNPRHLCWTCAHGITRFMAIRRRDEDCFDSDSVFLEEGVISILERDGLDDVGIDFVTLCCWPDEHGTRNSAGQILGEQFDGAVLACPFYQISSIESKKISRRRRKKIRKNED